MTVYLVRNLSNDAKFAPFIEKEKIFLNRKKAIKQYKKWCGESVFGQADFEKIQGIAEKVGMRSISQSDKGADIMAISVSK